MRISTIIFILLLLFTNKLSAKSVGMLTGSQTGTYLQFGKDIAAVSQKLGVNILVKPSKGSVDNIKRMASAENAAFAIVQSDVLGYLGKSNNPTFRRYAQRLRLVFPFYHEEVHLFARKDIKMLSDLQGKTVVVGPKSSGSNMTAWNILRITQIKPAKRLNASIDDGIAMVLRGDADAVFVIAGKPRKGFTNLFSTPSKGVRALLQQVHFVPLDHKALLAEYTPSTLSSQDYSFIEKTLPTVAVKALLVSFDFSSKRSGYYQQRCRQLRTISQAIRNNIETLREQHHKKWQQVDLNGDMGGWPMDKCSHTGSPNSSGGNTNPSSIEGDMNCIFNQQCTQ